ncbi:MAG: hypothetical protein JW863_04685 [Chitinispirillaceae bacterium]|nr:hypothetical protein [Chitinispirillaceae bacterium]
MLSAARVMALCMGCIVCTFAAAASTPDEVILMDAVIEDFTNRYGDKDDQIAFGAAKGVIENGTGRAYLGGGYWYGTADAGSSVISGIDNATKITTKITSAIDPTERFLHVIMTTSTSSIEYSYAAVGFNLTNATEYIDATNVTGVSVTASGTGTVRIDLITKNYMDAPAGENDWGFYGFDLALSSTKKTTTVTNAEIEPVPYSFGDPDGDGTGSSWAVDGAPELNKIQIQVKNGENADLKLYEIKFAGATYGDFGFVKVPVIAANSQVKFRNGLSVEPSRITYSVAQPQRCSINLLDMAGCRVANLFNGNAVAGTNIVPVSLGQMPGIAPGQYVVRVSGSAFTASRPVMIAK